MAPTSRMPQRPPTDTLFELFDEPRPDDTLPPSRDRIADRYEILGLLGVGGMGSVYRVRDLELDEVVALKRLRPELARAPGALERFRQEVKLARRVTHPNVVRTFDLGESGDARFLTMEYVEGSSLSQLLACRGHLSAPRAVALGSQLCAGLAAAHAAGVLHRDLKPDNVLVTPEGRAVITDFGIARAAARAGATHAGMVGTPAYMAPEQVEPGAQVDARADQYALGALLFELLTGQRAWPGDEVFAVALARLSHPPPDPREVRPDLPEALVRVIARCMARRPDERFPDIEAVARALATQDASHSIPTTTPRTVRAPEADAHALAVLPLTCHAPEDEWIAEGLTEELIDALSMAPELRVRPLTAVADADQRDPRATGEALGVQVVVTGTVRRSGDQIRLSIRLISVADGYQVWARRANTPPAAALALSDTLAEEIAQALTVQLQGPKRQQSEDPVAVELYLKGRAASHRDWHGDLTEAVALLSAARERAPGHPSILAAYASARARQAFSTSEGHTELLDDALAAAREAVERGPDLGEPWMALANVLLYRMDSAGAYNAVRTALARSPGIARAHELQGMLLFEAKRLEEAEVSLKTALSLDPGASQSRWELARLHALCGRWSAADAMLQPHAPPGDENSYAHAMVCLRIDLWRRRRCSLDLNAFGALNTERAATVIALAQTLDALVSGHRPETSATALASGRLRRSHGRQRLVMLQLMAEAASVTGEADQALQWLGVAVDLGLQDLAWADLCPSLELARSHPGWPALRQVVAERAARVTDRTTDG